MATYRTTATLLRFYQKNLKGFLSKANAPTDKSAEGFSILEAMVAMAILAAALIPILALQGQFVKSVESLERLDIRLAARSTAVSYIKALNLSQNQNGEFVHLTNAGPTRISWISTPATPPKIVRGNGGFAGRFELTLYDVNVTIDPENGGPEKFTIRALGWRPLESVADGI